MIELLTLIGALSLLYAAAGVLAVAIDKNRDKRLFR